MYVENLTHQVLREVLPIQLIWVEWLRSLSRQALELKVLRMQCFAVDLDEVVPVPPEKPSILQVLTCQDFNLFLRLGYFPLKLTDLVTGSDFPVTFLPTPNKAV